MLQAYVDGDTIVEGATHTEPLEPKGDTTFYGVISEGGTAENGHITLSKSEQSMPYLVKAVCGGAGAAAENNYLHATDATVTSIIVGGSASKDAANNNTVVLDNVRGKVDGLPHAYAAMAKKGTADNNTLIIAGGVLGDICGTDTLMEATNTHVILVGTGPFYDVKDGNTTHRIWGKEMSLGYVIGNNSYQGMANSTAMLDVYGTGITAANIGGFTGIQFDLCPCLQPGMTIITLNGGGVTNLTGVAISLEPKGNSTHLQQGSQVTLIKTNGTITGVDTKAITFKSGNFSKFTGSVTLSEDQTALILTVDFIGNDPIVPERDPLTEPSSVKSVLETRANAMALVNGGADFLVSNGIWQVRRTAAAGSRQDAGVTLPFVAVGGSSLRHETGSHIKANGMNLAVGIARQVNEHAIGAAFEYGFSNYDSYVDSLHANGKSKAWGAALLGDWNLGAGWHMDTIARVGKVRNSYSANIGGPVSYNESSTYAGASIGFGYMQKAGENGAFDTYLRYLYSHVNGGNATLSSGNHAHFRGVNSNRTVLGTRYVHELNTTTRAYAGAGWMQQYGCGAHGNVDGYTGPSPSLGGASGLFELGLQYMPAGGKGIGVDVNVTGWVGTQRGISGGIGLRYAF